MESAIYSLIDILSFVYKAIVTLSQQSDDYDDLISALKRELSSLHDDCDNAIAQQQDRLDRWVPRR